MLGREGKALKNFLMHFNFHPSRESKKKVFEPWSLAVGRMTGGRREKEEKKNCFEKCRSTFFSHFTFKRKISYQKWIFLRAFSNWKLWDEVSDWTKSEKQKNLKFKSLPLFFAFFAYFLLFFSSLSFFSLRFGEAIVSVFVVAWEKSH